MPELEITLGDRTFVVACQAGEEPFLQAAAQILDTEATSLQAKVGRLPDVRMLLMAGLMVADRMAAIDADLQQAKARMAQMERVLQQSGAAGSAQRALDGLEMVTLQLESLAERVQAQGG